MKLVVETLEARRLLARSQSFDDVAFEIGAMAADPGRDIAYVIDRTNDKILAIDTGTAARTVSHAPLGGDGSSVAVSPSGDTLYVAVSDTARIEVFSLPELVKIRTITPATSVAHIVADNQGRLYTAAYGALHQLDGQSGAVIATVSTAMWSPSLIRTNAAGTLLYTRQIGLTGGAGVCEEFDIGGGGAPVLLATYQIADSNGRDLAVDAPARKIYTADGGMYGVGITDMTANTRTSWAFGSAAYGSGVATRETSQSVFGVSGDPYGGGVFEFDKSSGVVKNAYPGTYTAMAQSIVVTPNDHVIFGTAYWTGTSAGYLYRLEAVGPGSLVVDDVPVARFTSASTAANGFTFDASASAPYKAGQTITGYAWRFGDGTTATGASVHHCFTAIGTHTVTLTVTSSTGLTDEYSTTVTVIDVAAPVDVARVESTAGVYRAGDMLSFVLIVTRAVHVTGGTPSLRVIVGTRQRTAPLTDGNGTAVLRFTLPVNRGDLDLDGVSIRGPLRLTRGTTIRDCDGNSLATGQLVAPEGIVVDTRPPFIVTVDGPAAGVYRTGEHLVFKVRFSQPIDVTGVPELAVRVGGQMRRAQYVFHAEAPANEAWFRYVIRPEDRSVAAISIFRALALPAGASIRYRGGEQAPLALRQSSGVGTGVRINP